MHRKSMESAQTLSHDIIKQQKQFDDEASGSSSEDEELERKPKIEDKDDFRSSSIAALRARAQEHSAKMFSSFDTRLSNTSGGGDLAQPGHYIAPPETQQSVF